METKLIKISLISFILLSNLLADRLFIEKSTSIEGGAYRGGIEIEDLDNDGDKDIVIAYGNANGHLRVYLNDGNENFTQKSELVSNISGSKNKSMSIGDLNGDGKVDILFVGELASEEKVVKIFLNDGSANFSEDTNLNITGVKDTTILIGDFNEDNSNDFLYSGYDSVSEKPITKIYLNDGSGNFSEKSHSIVGVTEIPSVSYGDLNGDNHKDILISGHSKDSGYYKKVTKIYLNDGNANFSEDTTNTSFHQIYRSDLKIVDLNGDNKNDIIYAGDSGSPDGKVTDIYLNNGSGTFTFDSNLTGVHAAGIGIGDLDGDNNNDIILTGSPYNYVITELYYNDGNANFTKDTSSTAENLWDMDQGKVIITDLNGDNLSDIILSSGYTKIYLQLINDAPVITEGSSISESINEDENLTFTLNATDNDGNTINWLIKTNGSNGVATISSSTGTSQIITYVPNSNYNGIDNFIIEVNDSLSKDSIDVNLTINSINDLPLVDKNSTTIEEGETITITYSKLNYIDVDASPSSLIYTLTTLPSYGDLNLSGIKLNINDTFTQSDINNSLLTYTNDINSSKDSFTFTISDGTDILNGEFNISINHKVIWTLEDKSTNEDEVLQIDLSKYAIDPDGNTSIIYSAESNDTSLATTMITNSVLSVIPIKDKSGVIDITTYAYDGESNSSKTIKITISAVEDTPTNTETNTTDGGFTQLVVNINASIVKYIINQSGYDYIAFSDSNNGNKLSVYRRSVGDETWSDVIGTNISANEITAINTFTMLATGKLMIGYNDKIDGNKFIFQSSTGINNLRKLKRVLGSSDWSDITPTGYSNAELLRGVVDSANNIYLAFKDKTNDVNRSMLMRYDGSNWEHITHEQIIVNPAEGTTNYFSASNVTDISMAIDSSNRVYTAYIDELIASSHYINAQTYSTTDNNISYIGDESWTYTLDAQAKRVAMDVNSSSTPIVAYIKSDNSLNVIKYNNSSWSYLGSSSILTNLTTNLGFLIDKNNIPYVAVVESNNTNQIKIKKYVNLSWSNVDTIIASGEINNLSMIKDSAGNPYITFNDLGDNNNSKIYFLERYKSFNVYENNLSVGAIQMNADTSLTFSLSGTDSLLFDINNSGYITIKSKLDYENPIDGNKDNYYEFNVSATDTNSKIARLFIKVKIEDLNNSAISDIDISNSSVAENSSNTNIGEFSITAIDSDSNIVYSLCDGSKTNGIFIISSNTLLTATTLDYESINSYTLCIKAVDINSSAYYEKEFTINVSDVIESTSSAYSSGSSTIIIKAEEDIATNEKTLQIEINSELEKDVIDTTTTKIVQTKDIILIDGTISKTVVEIPKDITKSTNIKAIVEVENNTQIKQTTLEAEDGVKVSISSDRSVTSKVKTDQIEAEVKINTNAEVEAKIIVQKKVEVTMKTPKGSQIKQESSGRVVSDIELKADTTKGVNPVELKMSAEINGNLVTTAKVTNENREVIIYTLALPNNVLSGNMELIKSSIGDNTYSAIKSTFKTDSSFILNKNSKRVIVEGENIQIITTSAWQKFEEKQYFNGKRTITLLLGSAKILRDNVEEKMENNVEYELISPLSAEASDIELTKIYSNSYLNIQKGWNLISTPIDRELNITNSFKYATLTYKYSNGWIKNSKILNQGEGLWVNYSNHIVEKIEGESYGLMFNNLNNGWNLLGVGRDVNLYELNQFNEIWAYDSKFKSWVKNPNTIYRGYGFWAKN